MKRIKLSGQYGAGQYALVDDEDYDFLISCGAWYGTKNGYVLHTFKVGGVSLPEYIHRVILQPTSDQQVDHKNSNPLDNRKSNIRLCTNQQNAHNTRAHRRNKTGYKGVYKHTQNKDSYIAQIQFPNEEKRMHLGVFKDSIEAAYVYDQFALALFGDFARLNIL